MSSLESIRSCMARLRRTLDSNREDSVETSNQTAWLQQISEQGNRPEEWLRFIQHTQEDTAFSTETVRLNYVTSLYAKALKDIPVDLANDNQAYAELQVSCAKFKSLTSVEEARSMFGQARYFARRMSFVHVAAADFEYKQGNFVKAKQILLRAKELDAKPPDLLKNALEALSAGQPDLVSAVIQNNANKADQILESAAEKENYQGDILLPRHSWLDSSNKKKRDRKTEPNEVQAEKAQHTFYTDVLKPSQPTAHDKTAPSDDSGVTLPLPAITAEGHGQSVDTDPGRTLRSCHSTPDCKQPSILSSGRKKGFGKPQRIPKRCSLPQVTEASPVKSYNPPLPVMPELDRSPVSFTGSLLHSAPLRISNSSSKAVNDFILPVMQDIEMVDTPEGSLSGMIAEVLHTDKRDSGDSEFDTQSTGCLVSLSREGTVDMVDQACHSSPASFSSHCSGGEKPVCMDISMTSPTSSNEDAVDSNLIDSIADSVAESSLMQSQNSTLLSTTRLLAATSTSGSLQPPDNQVPEKQCTTTAPHSPVQDHQSTASTHSQPPETPQLSHSEHHSLRQSLKTPLPKNPPLQTPVHRSRHPSQATGPTNVYETPLPAQHMRTPSHNMSTPAPAVNPAMSFLATPMGKKKAMLMINNKQYMPMSEIGKGGTSKVYLMFDCELNQWAVKVVDLNGADERTIANYQNEIALLKRLQYSPRVIRMLDYEFNQEDQKLYVVMERGETDLSTLFRTLSKEGTLPPLKIKFYWLEMLETVQDLHQAGIVHSDLKPANFMLVSGALKLIDFGIANDIQPDMTSIILDQTVGTVNYMSPEAIMDTSGGRTDERGRTKPRLKIGVKSDVWSLGCILYNLVYRCTPFQHINNQLLKLQAIINPAYQIKFPAEKHVNEHLLDTLRMCLQRDPKQRPSISELLKHPYLQ